MERGSPKSNFLAFKITLSRGQRWCVCVCVCVWEGVQVCVCVQLKWAGLTSISGVLYSGTCLL